MNISTIRITLPIIICTTVFGTVLKETFDDIAQVHASWKGNIIIREGSAAFSGNGTTALASHELPIDDIRGKTIIIRAKIKASDVSKKKQPHHGIKLMVHYRSPSGQKYPQAAIPDGTFDWKEVSFFTAIPDSCVAAAVTIGLELGSGTVWFDDILITVGSENDLRPFPERAPSLPLEEMKPWGTFRGANINRELTQKDILDFAATGGNLLRINFAFSPLMKKKPPYELDESSFAVLARLIGYCRDAGIYALIDPHTYPGTRDNFTMHPDDEFWKDYSWHEHLILLWKEIALRYRDNKTVVGYDLMNEPHLPNGGKKDTPADYNLLVKKIIRAIRMIDSNHTIIIATPVIDMESGMQLTRLQGIDYMDPPIDSQVAYKPHMYEPGMFTHFGIYFKDRPFASYPGWIDGKEWSSKTIADVFAPTARFAKKYNVAILIGEFSVVRWAGESGERYIADVIDYIENQSWSWCYHAWRASDAWDPEMKYDRADMNRYAETPRLCLLQQYYLRNKSSK